MIKDNWIKAFDEKRIKNLKLLDNKDFKHGWMMSDRTANEIKTFISQVEKDAEKRGYLQASKDLEEANKEFDKTEKEIVEKTNKRWRERIEKRKEPDERCGYCAYCTGEPTSGMCWRFINNQLLSDLLEDKS